MVLYAAGPTSVIMPGVIVTLGSIAYFCSLLEVVLNGFLARERRLQREIAQNANNLRMRPDANGE